MDNHNKQAEVYRSKPIRRDGDGNADDGMLAMKPFMMPGGAGTSKPVAMKPSNPVNINPDHVVEAGCAVCFGLGRGKDGAI